MCGIAGILQYRPGSASFDPRDIVGRMNANLAHRGPDAEGLWSSANGLCHLGHRRLSIIDLTAAANQPMLDVSNRYAIVFNGEVYNFKQLRESLEKRGLVFKTRSDTEVLLQGFAADGVDIFSKLDGMFAVAIYDTVTGKLTLARDRAGEKLLYYVKGSAHFAFASELRALLNVPGAHGGISEEALGLYMALRYVPAPGSILKGIHKLPPASILEIAADGTVKESRYYAFSAPKPAPTPPLSQDAFAEQVEAALIESLRARRNSDVPLGAFLSSGVDSALVCSLLTKRLNINLKTFTVGFEGDIGSEHAAAADIARLLGTEHQTFIFGAAAFDEVCENIGDLLDEPNGDRSCVPTYLLSRFARAHVTTAISGDGGDELFAGYARYAAFVQKFGKTAWPNPAAISRTYFEQSLPVFPWQGIRETLPEAMAAVMSFVDAQAPFLQHPAATSLMACVCSTSTPICPATCWQRSTA